MRHSEAWPGIGVACLALTLASAPAHASPAEVFGLGSRHAGQAGAGVATVDDVAAPLVNPAGLARSPGKRLSLGALGAWANLRINDRRTGLTDPAGTVLGLTLPAPLGGPLADRVHLGLAMYVLPGSIARIVARFPDEPFYPYYQGRTERLVILPGVGVRVRPGLEVGVARPPSSSPARRGRPGSRAPFPGRVVAARTGASSPIGSPNFVLLRHDLNIGRPVRFFTLYMHTADEPGGEGAPRWLAGKSKRVLDGEREVLGFDEAVEAGEVVGHAGEVGPDALYASQIHLEIFSREEVFRGDADWQKVDGAAGFRFCEAEEVNQLIDNDKDGRLSRVELDEYYAGGEVGDDMRRLVTYHVSEWTDEPAWAEELARSLPDFRKRSGKKKVQSHDADDEDLDIGALVSDQLDPFIWWTEPVAAALGLPRDGTVFHYHPMRFIEKVNLKLADRGSHDVREEDARLVDTTQVTDDSSGEGMFHEVEQKNPDDLHLTVEDLEAGWVGDRPAPGRGGPP